ncbi:MAG: DUF2254 domain-containing protein [Alphaproteobacteria bacterium]|nr:DUF2254 domain-containing protein [Alphaproteobacteria bacterium]
MLSRLYNFLQIIRESLLFAPALVCVVYFFGVLVLLGIERMVLAGVEGFGLFFQGEVAEAKAVISLLLSAMITMTTLAVSITVVVLSLAASQLGPRLIKSFMSDRQTQIYIGIFFGTVTMCFVMTGILHDSSLATPTPRVTITAVFAACFLDLFVLLAFVNHVARSCIADHVIDKVSRELFSAIDRLSEPGAESTDPCGGDLPPDFEMNARRVYFQRPGYVQHIDYRSMLTVAEKHHLFIRVDFKAGYYLLPGEDGLKVYPAHNLSPDLEKQLMSAFIVGRRRTPTQDIEYAMRHLTEIGMRALSPGINDAFTAIAVINRLSAAIAHLFGKHIPDYTFRDSAGRCRVAGKSLTIDEIITDGISPIRKAGEAHPSILNHLLRKIDVLLAVATRPAQKEGLHRELSMIGEAIERNFAGTIVGGDLRALYREVAGKV